MENVNWKKRIRRELEKIGKLDQQHIRWILLLIESYIDGLEKK